MLRGFNGPGGGWLSPALFCFGVAHVDRKRHVARTVAVRVRHDGVALLFYLPSPAAELRRGGICVQCPHDT
jgi:hypothetical protein